MILSPSPLSLLCALLLCLPLAVIVTLNTTIISPAATSAAARRSTPSNIENYPLPGVFSRNGKYPLPKDGNLGESEVELAVLASAPPPGRRPPPKSPPTPPPPKVEEVDVGEEWLFEGAGRVRVEPRRDPAHKKVAFMFLTTVPLPFAPLWEVFFNATPRNLYNIYVHADPSYNYTTPFRGVFAGRVIPSKPTRRNTATLTAAARRLLAHALLHDESNYAFALLSPLCIPLHSFNFTYATVTNSNRSFIEILAREPWAYERWAARGEDAMLPEVKFEDFRIGSQFFILTRKHARIIVRDRRLWSKFKLPCLDTYACFPEENYFSTLLNMVDPQGCAHATLTHVDWRGSHGGHPRMYQACEVGPELIMTLRKDRPRYGDEEINGSDPSLTNRLDPFLFARKFSPASIKPLLSIAKDVILKD